MKKEHCFLIVGGPDLLSTAREKSESNNPLISQSGYRQPSASKLENKKQHYNN
jgi:hypothetical protein